MPAVKEPALENKLLTITKKVKDLPVFPEIASKVAKVVSDPRTNSKKLVDLLSKDVALTTRLLKIANSPFYRRNVPTTTLSQAVTLLGFDAIKSAVLAASLKDAFKRSGLAEKLLWDHSVGVANASGLLSRRLGHQNHEELFTAGLLHDIGKMVLLNECPQDYQIVYELVYNDHLSFQQAEEEVLGFSHVEVGVLVARKWKLEEIYRQIIFSHHDLILVSDKYKDEVAIVSMADRICQRLGIGYRNPYPEMALEDCESFDEIGLPVEVLEDFEEDMKQLAESQSPTPTQAAA